ncbi:hypothetical protein ABPG72_013499 [Tetrahymena utriculariae]
MKSHNFFYFIIIAVSLILQTQCLDQEYIPQCPQLYKYYNGFFDDQILKIVSIPQTNLGILMVNNYNDIELIVIDFSQKRSLIRKSMYSYSLVQIYYHEQQNAIIAQTHQEIMLFDLYTLNQIKSFFLGPFDGILIDQLSQQLFIYSSLKISQVDIKDGSIISQFQLGKIEIKTKISQCQIISIKEQENKLFLVSLDSFAIFVLQNNDQLFWQIKLDSVSQMSKQQFHIYQANYLSQLFAISDSSWIIKIVNVDPNLNYQLQTIQYFQSELKEFMVINMLIKDNCRSCFYLIVSCFTNSNDIMASSLLTLIYHEIDESLTIFKKINLQFTDVFILYQKDWVIFLNNHQTSQVFQIKNLNNQDAELYSGKIQAQFFNVIDSDYPNRYILFDQVGQILYVMDFSFKILQQYIPPNGISQNFRFYSKIKNSQGYYAFISFYDPIKNPQGVHGVYLYNENTNKATYNSLDHPNQIRIEIVESFQVDSNIFICFLFNTQYVLNQQGIEDVIQRYKYHRYECNQYTQDFVFIQKNILDDRQLYLNGLNQSPLRCGYHTINNYLLCIEMNGLIHKWSVPSFQIIEHAQTSCVDTFIFLFYEEMDIVLIDCSQNDITVYLDLKSLTIQILRENSTWMISGYINKKLNLAMFNGSGDNTIYFYDLNKPILQSFQLPLTVQTDQLIIFSFQVNQDLSQIILFSTDFYGILEISDCLKNVSQCQQKCQFNLYFDLSLEKQSLSQDFGQGTQINPFLSIRCIKYLFFFSNEIQIELNISQYVLVNVFIDDSSQQIEIQYDFQNNEMLTNAFILTNLKIQPSDQEKLIRINCQESLLIQDAYGLEISNYIINFNNPALQNKSNLNISNLCQLQFTSMQYINITDSKYTVNQSKRYTEYPLNLCGQMQLKNTKFVSIQNLQFNQTYIYQPFITLDNVQNLNIIGLVISQSSFQTFGIVQIIQGSTQLVLQNVLLTENHFNYTNDQQQNYLFDCTTCFLNNSLIQINFFNDVQFFRRLGQVNQLDIKGDLVNPLFSFRNISIQDNFFKVKNSKTIFINVVFPELDSPDYQIIIQQFNFQNNQIRYDDANTNQNQQEQKISIFSSLNINQIIISDINLSKLLFLNFFTSQNGQEFQIQNIYFENNFGFLAQNFQQQQQQYYSFLQIQDVSSLLIENALFQNCQIINNSFIYFSNILQKQGLGSINLQNITFNQTKLFSSQVFTQSNPIEINYNQPIQINIINCYFIGGILNAPLTNYKKSTTGISISATQGQLDIKKSQFYDNQSTGFYNSLFIQIYELSIQQCQFKNNTSQQQLHQIVNQNIFNSFIQVIASQMYFNSITFSYGISNYQPILQAQSLNQQFNITIENCSFENSMSLKGSLIQIDFLQSISVVKLKNNIFHNIIIQEYSNQLISFSNFNKQENLYFSQLDMENNNLTNMYSSAADCQLLNFQSGYVQIKNISFSLQTVELPFQVYLNLLKNDIYPCIQIFIQDSLAFITDYRFSGYNSDQYLSSTLQNNLILNQINCDTLIKNMIITNFQLQQHQSLISSQFGFLNITQSTIQNIFRDIQENKYVIQQYSQSYISTFYTIFEITQSKFQNINCPYCQGGIFYFEESNGQINNCEFLNNTSFAGGSIFFINLQEYTLIDSCVFEQNQCSDGNGGAISLFYNEQSRFNFNVIHSNFSKCSSQNYGGAISILQQFYQKQNDNFVKLYNLKFTDNIAKIGGALYYQNIIPVQENIFYNNNYAKLFGTNFYSGFPTSLKLITNNQIINQDNQTSYIPNFRSGDTLQEINIQFYDQNDQLVIIQEQDFKNTWIQIDDNSNQLGYNLQGVKVAQYLQNKTYIKIPENILTGIPKQQIVLNIYSDQIYQIQNNQIFQSNLIHQIKINFRECLLGEIKVEFIQGQYLNRTLIQCIKCNIGTYSFDFKKCSACPQEAKCYGGSNVSISQGYWRSSTVSMNILQCQSQDDTSCIGGSGAGHQLCKKGYIGSLCIECDVQKYEKLLI